MSRFALGTRRLVGRQIVAHLRIPLYWNAYALMLSAAATSGLGLLYWALAARYYPTAVVGTNSAYVAAMMLVSGVAQLNLEGALLRFLPRAGRMAGRLVGFSYLACLGVTVLLGAVFLLARSIWPSVFSLPHASTALLLWFFVATMAWGIFAMQDNVLTGLRQATWVPVENAIFGVVKIILLVLFAHSLHQFGIFASWTIPTVLSLLPVNVLLFWYLIPRHARASQDGAVDIIPTHIVRYVSGDYLGYLFTLASTTLLPIIVTRVAGARANAYFYLAWIIAYSLQLVAINMVASFTVEAAREDTQLPAFTMRVLRHTARLLLPAVGLLLLAAPYVLRIYGDPYARGGTALLRLLALAAIPNIVIALYTGVARVQRRTDRIVLVQAALCIAVLGLTYLLLPRYGITGVGIAWLASESLLAAVLIAVLFRPFSWIRSSR